MRIAVLGDIHGNALALQAVLEDVRGEGIAHLLITGDFVGYYYQPAQVFTLLAEWVYQAVQGNHDAMLLVLLDDPARAEEFRQRFGHGLERARDQLPEASIAFVRGLPTRRDVVLAGRHILLCHGAPWDRDLYVYPDWDEAVLRRCAAPGVDLVLMGHTHYPMLHHVGGTVIANPGAVGQPRDGDPRAAWALVDLERLEVTFQRTPYAVERVVAEARQVDPDLPYLADVLQRRLRTGRPTLGRGQESRG